MKVDFDPMAGMVVRAVALAALRTGRIWRHLGILLPVKRIAVRLSSTDTNGAYAIVESVTAPGCSPPMHLHRNEEEHFVVLAGTYRILIEDKVFDAPVGTSITCPSPKLHPHGIEPACNIVTSSSHFGRDGDVAVWQITC